MGETARVSTQEADCAARRCRVEAAGRAHRPGRFSRAMEGGGRASPPAGSAFRNPLARSRAQPGSGGEVQAGCLGTPVVFDSERVLPGLRRPIPLDRPELRASCERRQCGRTATEGRIPSSNCPVLAWMPRPDGWRRNRQPAGSDGVPFWRSRWSQGRCLPEVIPARGVHAAWSVDARN